MRTRIGLCLTGLWLVAIATCGPLMSGRAGAQTVGVFGAPSAVTVGPPPILTLDGDPLWTPTLEQFRTWVAQGVEAAAAGMYLADLPVVEKWMWSFEEPVDLPAGRGMPFMVMLTPELAGVISGYAAAWNETTWEELQADPGQVISDLANRLRQSLPKREVTFAVAVLHDNNLPMEGVVWYEGMWRYLGVASGRPLRRLVKKDLSPSALDPLWVVGYLLGQMLDRPALAQAPNLSVRLCSWSALSRRWPGQEFVLALEPPGFSKDQMRVAIGNSEAFGYVDWKRP